MTISRSHGPFITDCCRLAEAPLLAPSPVPPGTLESLTQEPVSMWEMLRCLPKIRLLVSETSQHATTPMTVYCSAGIIPLPSSIFPEERLWKVAGMTALEA